MEEVKEIKTIKASRWEIEQQLNTFIGSIKVNGLDKDCKVSLVKLKIKLSDIIEKINAFRKKAVEDTIKPEGYDALKEKIDNNTATSEEKEEFTKVETEYNKELGEVIIPFLNEVVEIEFDGITEEQFWKIVENSEVEVIFGYEYLKHKLVK